MRAERAAALAGVTGKALRYYEDQGLLTPGRLPNGYRDFTAVDVQLAVEIRRLMSLGLSAKETLPFLDCLRDGHDEADDCPEPLATYQHKIDNLERLIAQLIRDRDELSHRMRTAARRGFRLGTGEPSPREHVRTEHVMLPSPDPLPAGLPMPVDDGAARHLTGLTLPPLKFTATNGERVQLDTVSAGRWLLFLYPLTGEPGVDVPRGWDQIPGARGCSQEACGFRDNLARLHDGGVSRILGMSTDRADYQQDLVHRLHLPYPMLSDPDLRLAYALGLPTFDAIGMRLYKRLTLVVDAAMISHVFYPIFPPDRHAEDVLDWLSP